MQTCSARARSSLPASDVPARRSRARTAGAAELPESASILLSALSNRCRRPAAGGGRARGRLHRTAVKRTMKRSPRKRSLWPPV